MSDQLAHTFIDALHALEASRDAEPLTQLYAPDAKLGNVIAPDRFTGPEGARRFWTEYRGTFQDLRSEFRNVITEQDRAALEWTTTGAGPDGKPFTYNGVTVLEIRDGKITRSCAYFDPSALGRQIEPQA